MYYNFRLFWRTTYRSYFASKDTPAHLTRKRITFLLLFYLVWPIGSLIHWFCFFLDDILFPAHKTQPIEKPLFILGNLRSGSTFLHRLLSRDFRDIYQPDDLGYLPDSLGDTKEDHAILRAPR